MADINTESSKGSFVFGQNMESRVVKSAEGEAGNGEAGDTDDGGNSQSSSPRPDEGGQAIEGDRPLLRPSVFSASPAHNQGMVGSAAISNNPFGGRVSQPSYSDSDDEKKDKPIVAPAVFNPSPFGARGLGFGSPSASRLLLKPSSLDKQTANFNKHDKENDRSGDFKTSFKLEPAKLQNPFLKTDSASEKEISPAKSAEPSSKAIPDATPEGATGGEDTPEVEARLAEPTDTTDTQSTDETTTSSKNSFTPISNSTDSSSNSFLFGQNMQTRVFGSGSENAEAADGEEPPGSGSFIFGQSIAARVISPSATTNGNGTSLEGATAENAATSPESDRNVSLVESAAAHQAKLARPEFDEVEVKTGEEDESNVFQINVKLFLFDKENQNWKEKGRGQLRLNDMTCSQSQSFQSRLVMRTQGSLRVVMNTNIWPSMLVEMASDKSVRITAIDQEEGVKIFLIMTSRSEASHIYNAIHSRVQQLKASEQSDKDEPSSESTQNTSQTLSQPPTQSPEKRKFEVSPDEQPSKRPKTRHNVKSEESNDSSTVDPETEASNESSNSSPTVKSSSSD